MNEDQIKARIAELEQEKEAHLGRANCCHGGVQELQRLLGILAAEAAPAPLRALKDDAPGG